MLQQPFNFFCKHFTILGVLSELFMTLKLKLFDIFFLLAMGQPSPIHKVFTNPIGSEYRFAKILLVGLSIYPMKTAIYACYYFNKTISRRLQNRNSGSLFCFLKGFSVVLSSLVPALHSILVKYPF